MSLNEWALTLVTRVSLGILNSCLHDIDMGVGTMRQQLGILHYALAESNHDDRDMLSGRHHMEECLLIECMSYRRHNSHNYKYIPIRLGHVDKTHLDRTYCLSIHYALKSKQIIITLE